MCKRRLCGSKGRKGSEDAAIQNANFTVQVALKRDSSRGQKFGIGICSDPRGGLKVTSVDDGGILHAWNLAQPRPERRICVGDRIIVASGTVGGKPVRATAA